MKNKENKKVIFLEEKIESFKGTASIIHSLIRKLALFPTHKNVEENDLKELISHYLSCCDVMIKKLNEDSLDLVNILLESDVERIFIYHEDELSENIAKALIRNELKFWDDINQLHISAMEDAYEGSSVEEFIKSIIPSLSIVTEEKLMSKMD